MKLSKKGGGIAVAVMMAGGIAAASTTSAFAAGSGTPHTTPVAKSAAKDKNDGKAGHHKTGHHKGGRHARFLHGTHGEKTVKDKDGKTVTHEWQVGKVTATAAGTLTVKSSDGVTWTWSTSAQTKVHSAGHAAPKVGDEVLVQGVKSGTANVAHSVLDPDQAQLAKWLAGDGKTGDQGQDGTHRGSQGTDKDGHHAPTGKHRRTPTAPAAPHNG